MSKLQATKARATRVDKRATVVAIRGGEAKGLERFEGKNVRATEADAAQLVTALVKGLTPIQYKILCLCDAPQCAGCDPDKIPTFTAREWAEVVKLQARGLVLEYDCFGGTTHAATTGLGRVAKSAHEWLLRTDRNPLWTKAGENAVDRAVASLGGA
jgi:hypothetical protein